MFKPARMPILRRVLLMLGVWMGMFLVLQGLQALVANQQISEVEGNLAVINQDVSGLAGNVEEVSSRVEGIATRVTSISERIRGVDDQITSIQSKVKESLEKSKQIAEDTLRRRVHEAVVDLAARIELIVKLRPWIRQKGPPASKELVDLAKNVKIGKEGFFCLIDPKKGTVVLHRDDVDVQGRPIAAHLPEVMQLMSSNNYLLQLAEREKTPGLVNRQTVYADAFTRTDDRGNSVRTFWVITPVRGTPWTVAAFTLFAGIHKELFGEVESALDQVTKAAAGVRTAAAETSKTAGQLNKTTSDARETAKAVGSTALSVTKATKNVGERARSIAQKNMVVLIAVGVFGIVLSMFFARRVHRLFVVPLRHLTTVAERIRGGEYDTRASVNTGDELETLGESLNSMLDRIVGLIESDEAKKRLQEHIMQLLEIVSAASKGDLTARGEVTSDALGPVSDAFNAMLDGIGELVGQVRRAGARVTAGANKILVSAQQIATGAEAQEREIETTTGSVMDVSRSMRKVSESAGSAAEGAHQATEVAANGARAVENTVEGMRRIRTDVQATSRKIKNLGDRSTEINAIVELIDDIAKQTNTIALNATIEASRAGEAGKTFVVVADEVLKLAERTSAATKDISGFIEKVQEETNEVVEHMQAVNKEVEEGARLADEAGAALKEIEVVVNRMAERIREIFQDAVNQARGTERVAEAMHAIRRVTQETAGGISYTLSTVRELHALSRELDEALKRFRIKSKFEDEVRGVLRERHELLERATTILAKLSASEGGAFETSIVDLVNDLRRSVEEVEAGIKTRIEELDTARREAMPGAEVVQLRPQPPSGAGQAGEKRTAADQPAVDVGAIPPDRTELPQT